MSERRLFSEEDLAHYKRVCPTEFRLWARLYRRVLGVWPLQVARERIAWAEEVGRDRVAAYLR